MLTDSSEIVLKSFKSSLYVCLSASLCPQSYLSVWLHNKPAFMLERRAPVRLSRPYPIVPTYSIRPRVEAQAQPTATYYLPSLSRTPRLYLCFSLTNCFVIYVAFLKPLIPQAAAARMDLSLCINPENSSWAHTCVVTCGRFSQEIYWEPFLLACDMC